MLKQGYTFIHTHTEDEKGNKYITSYTRKQTPRKSPRMHASLAHKTD